MIFERRNFGTFFEGFSVMMKDSDLQISEIYLYNALFV